MRQIREEKNVIRIFISRSKYYTTLNLYKYYNTSSHQIVVVLFLTYPLRLFSLYSFLPLFFWQLQKITNMCIASINKE